MFFDSRKEKKKEKEKEGGTASVRREVIRTNNTDENYRAIPLDAFPCLTRINGQKGRINWFNGQKGRKKAYMLRSNNFI